MLLSFSLLPILHVTSSEKIMGQHKSSSTTIVLIWLLALAVLAINIYLVVSRIGGGQPWWVYTISSLVGAVYLAFSYSLVKEDVANGWRALFWARTRSSSEGSAPDAMKEKEEEAAVAKPVAVTGAGHRVEGRIVIQGEKSSEEVLG